MRYVCFPHPAKGRMTDVAKFFPEKRSPFGRRRRSFRSRRRHAIPKASDRAKAGKARHLSGKSASPPEKQRLRLTENGISGAEKVCSAPGKGERQGGRPVCSASAPQQKNRETGGMFPRLMTAAQCFSASARVRAGSSVRKVRLRYRKRPSTMVCTTFSCVA